MTKSPGTNGKMATNPPIAAASMPLISPRRFSPQQVEFSHADCGSLLFINLASRRGFQNSRWDLFIITDKLFKETQEKIRNRKALF